jgi:hypothetical protein
MKGDRMNKSQEIPRTCGNCYFSEDAPQTSMNDVPDPKDVKCSQDGHYYNATDEACGKWGPRCVYYHPESEVNKRCELLGPKAGNISSGPSFNDRTSVGQRCEPDSCTFLASQKDEQKQ